VGYGSLLGSETIMPYLIPRAEIGSGEGWKAFLEIFIDDEDREARFIHLQTDGFNKRMARELKNRIKEYSQVLGKEGVTELFTYVPESKSEMKRLPEFMGFKLIERVEKEGAEPHFLYVLLTDGDI
jgi:hypothetical protein